MIHQHYSKEWPAKVRGQDAELLARLLSDQDIQLVLRRKPELKEKVEKRAKTRTRTESSKKDDERFAMFFEYKGTDEKTLSLLTRFYDLWLTNPLSFWYRPRSCGGFSRCRDPLADLIREYMETEPCAGYMETKRELFEDDC